MRKWVQSVNGALGNGVGSRQRKAAWGPRSTMGLDTQHLVATAGDAEKPLLSTCSGQNQLSTVDAPGLQESSAQGRARRQRSPSVTLHL